MPFEFWLWAGAWLAFLTLTIVYGFGSPWWESAIGRSLLPMKVFLLATLTHVLATYLFGDYPWSDVVRVLCVGGVTVMAWVQVFVWLRIQRGARRAAPNCPRRRRTDH